MIAALVVTGVVFAVVYRPDSNGDDRSPHRAEPRAAAVQMEAQEALKRDKAE